MPDIRSWSSGTDGILALLSANLLDCNNYFLIAGDMRGARGWQGRCWQGCKCRQWGIQVPDTRPLLAWKFTHHLQLRSSRNSAYQKFKNFAKLQFSFIIRNWNPPFPTRRQSVLWIATAVFIHERCQLLDSAARGGRWTPPTEAECSTGWQTSWRETGRRFSLSWEDRLVIS